MINLGFIRFLSILLILAHTVIGYYVVENVFKTNVQPKINQLQSSYQQLENSRLQLAAALKEHQISLQAR